VDISRPSDPRAVGSCATEDFANGIVVKGEFAYVSDAGSGLEKFDISRPSSPRLVAAYNTPGDAQAVALDDSFIFVSDSYSLLILK
jgi:hypothetical protein